MEKALIKKIHVDKIERVYEFEDVHYFYWKREIGVGFSKIWGLKVLLPLIKIDDHEPVKIVRSNKNHCAVLTRFHYDILAYFNDPLLKDNPPVVEFSIGSHSPIIFSGEGDEIEVGYSSKIKKGLSALKADYAMHLMNVYRKIIEHSLFKELNEAKFSEYPPILCQNPGDEHLLRPETMTSIFYVGRIPSPTELKRIKYYTNKRRKKGPIRKGRSKKD